jgi:hypothetical protein
MYLAHPYLNHMLILLLVPSGADMRKACNEFNEVSCLMLVSIIHGLQKRFEDQPAYDMIGELKNIFQEQAHVK